MAHGYLSYSPVTGEGPLGPWLYDKLGKLIKKEGKKQGKKLLDGVKDLLKKDKDTTYRNAIGKRFDVTGKRGGENTAKGGGIFGASKEPKGLLAAGKGGLVKREDRESALGKNPTNSDKKEGNLLGPAGSTGRARKGGGPVDMGGAVSKGLNKDAFFQATTQGIDSSTGEYLSREDRIAKFKQGMLADRAADTAPAIRPDIGADIVAAMAKNTQAIITLVDTTEKQTQSGVNIAEKQAQAQDTLFSRQKASKEEKALEQGEDLSGFMTPEKIMKAIKPPKSKDGGGEKDGKGGGLPLMGGGKGLAGKAGKLLGPVAKWTAIIGTGLLAGMSLGTHLWHQNNDRKKANAPKSDRLGNLLDDDGNVLSGPSAPTQDEQFVDNNTGERYDPPLPPIEPVEDPNKNPGYNQGGLISGGKANLVDDVPINADEGEVVMSNRAGNMFGRGALMSMNSLAGSTNTPSSGGGYAQGGLIGVSSQSRKMYKAFGQGIVDAQLDEKKKLAEIQGEGLKNYFETKGGFEKMGEGLQGFFEGLGGVFTSLFRRSPDTPGGPGGPGGGMSADEQQLTEALIAGEEGMKTEAYQDSNGIWTIGYGQTQLNGKAVKQGDKITKEEALTGFRGAVAEHQQRAIKQLGEKRWEELDSRSRAVLSSLTYNYGSIPDSVLPAAKTGSAEDIAKAMDSLHGDEGGDLKGRRQREQSILRGGTSNRLDKDFMAGGKLAGAGTGPQVMGAGISSKEGTGMATFGETDGGSGRLVNNTVNGVEYVHGHFQSNTGTRRDVINDTAAMVRGMLNSGLTDIYLADDSKFLPSMSDGEIKGLVERGLGLHGHSGDGRSVDIFVPKGTPVPFPLTDVRNADSAGRTGMIPGTGNTWVGHLTADSQSGAKNVAAAVSAEPDAGGGGAATPSSALASNPSPLTAEQKAKMFKKVGMPTFAASALSSPPGPVAASPASPQTGTSIMATSAQVASASNVGAAPIINNNYYSSGGGQQNGTPTPNSVATGINMNDAGLAAFNELKLRTS